MIFAYGNHSKITLFIDIDTIILWNLNLLKYIYFTEDNAISCGITNISMEGISNYISSWSVNIIFFCIYLYFSIIWSSISLLYKFEVCNTICQIFWNLFLFQWKCEDSMQLLCSSNGTLPRRFRKYDYQRCITELNTWKCLLNKRMTFRIEILYKLTTKESNMMYNGQKSLNGIFSLCKFG